MLRLPFLINLDLIFFSFSGSCPGYNLEHGESYAHSSCVTCKCNVSTPPSSSYFLSLRLCYAFNIFSLIPFISVL